MSALPRPLIDQARVRRLFSRRQAPSFIVREVASRMSERLDLMKLDPQVVLDLGAGDGIDRGMLEQRYPEAAVIALDLEPSRELAPPVSGLARLRSLFGRRVTGLTLQGDFTSLPLASASVDLAWSNCALHWVSDADGAIAEWSRVLKPDAALLFSCFGPDSLKEVREAFLGIDGCPHALAFTDLHDYGDMLASHGFAQPVMDMERLTLTYQSADGFWADVRALGGNPLEGARRGLLSPRLAAQVNDNLATTRNASGQFQLTIEIVTGHAWKGTPKTRSDGLSVVSMPTPRRQATP